MCHVFFFSLVVLAFVSTRIFCCSVCFVSFTPMQIHVILEVKSASPFYLFRLSKVIINELWCLIPPIDCILSKESNTLTLNWPLPVCMGREREKDFEKRFSSKILVPPAPRCSKNLHLSKAETYISTLNYSLPILTEMELR